MERVHTDHYSGPLLHIEHVTAEVLENDPAPYSTCTAVAAKEGQRGAENRASGRPIEPSRRIHARLAHVSLVPDAQQQLVEKRGSRLGMGDSFQDGACVGKIAQIGEGDSVCNKVACWRVLADGAKCSHTTVRPNGSVLLR